MEKSNLLFIGGTDNHIIWLDLRPTGLNGSRVEKVLEDISIACNKNTVPGDKSAMNPSGIRLGTPALTTRGLKESDMLQVAEFIHQGKVKNNFFFFYIDINGTGTYAVNIFIKDNLLL